MNQSPTIFGKLLQYDPANPRLGAVSGHTSDVNLGEWIKQNRFRLGLKQSQLAKYLEITPQYLGQVERGEKPGVSALLFSRLVRVFGSPPDSVVITQMARQPESSPPIPFIDRGRISDEEMRRTILREIERERWEQEQVESLLSGRVKGDPENRIPLMNNAPAGDPHDYGDMDYPPGVAAVDYIDRGDIDPELPAEAFTVVGDSMEPEYRHGDICIIGVRAPKEGQDCFVRISEDAAKYPGSCTFKRVSFVDDAVILRPINADPKHKIIAVPREHVRLFPVIEQRRKR